MNNLCEERMNIRRLITFVQILRNIDGNRLGSLLNILGSLDIYFLAPSFEEVGLVPLVEAKPKPLRLFLGI